mgnify:CR=1 FL=1
MIRRVLERLFSFVLSTVIFGWVAAPIHEGFHLLAAKSLGGGGRIDLMWGGYGLFAYTGLAQGWEILLMKLAGGLGTAVVVGVLWAISAYQLRYTLWELDDVAGLALIALLNLAYAPMDAFFTGQWVPMLISALFAVGIWTLLYGKRIIVWIAIGNGKG